jgi:hypothetical protein
MNYYKKLFMIVFVLIFGQGCASTLRMQPVTQPEQSTIFQDGQEALMSSKSDILVTVRHKGTYQSDERLSFIVAVYNGTETPFDFSTENISVTLNGRPLKVFTHEEIAKEMRREQVWLAIAAGFSAASASYQAAMVPYVPSSTGIRGSTYNPSAAAQTQAFQQAQTTQRMENAINSLEAGLKELSNTILKKQTILPQSWYGGRVVVNKTPAPERENIILFEVKAGNENYFFKFVQTKVK